MNCQYRYDIDQCNWNQFDKSGAKIWWALSATAEAGCAIRMTLVFIQTFVLF